MWIFLFNYPRCLYLKTGRLFYDDRCNLCKKTVLFIKAIDFYDRIEVQGFSKAPSKVQQVFSNDIQIVYQEKEDLLLGYNAYHRISTSIFPFCILFPLFFLGKLTGLGPKAYHWVGQRRTQLFGVCEPFFILRKADPPFRPDNGRRGFLISF